MATVSAPSVPEAVKVRSGSQALRAMPSSALAAATARSVARTSGRRTSRSMDRVSGRAGTDGSWTGGAVWPDALSGPSAPSVPGFTVFPVSDASAVFLKPEALDEPVPGMPDVCGVPAPDASGLPAPDAEGIAAPNEPICRPSTEPAAGFSISAVSADGGIPISTAMAWRSVSRLLTSSWRWVSTVCSRVSACTTSALATRPEACWLRTSFSERSAVAMERSSSTSRASARRMRQ